MYTKWFRLARIETNQGIFKIIFHLRKNQNGLKSHLKKKTDLSHLGPNLTSLGMRARDRQADLTFKTHFPMS